MKKLLIIIAILVMVVPAFAYTVDGCWEETICEICGERIYRWQEPRVFPYMPSVTGDGSLFLMPDKLPAQHLITPLIKVCPKCYQKYNKEYSKVVEMWIKEKQNGLSEQRILNEIRIRQEDVKEIEDQIKKLKQKKRLLKEEQ